MTRRNFYIVALWLPLIWPVVISIGELFLHSFVWHQMSRVSGLIILSGIFGGIQYLLFAVVISHTFADKDTYDIGKKSWFLPLVLAPLCSVTLWGFFRLLTMHASQVQVRANEAGAFDISSVCVGIALFALICGYTYLFLIHALLALLEYLGYLEE